MRKLLLPFGCCALAPVAAQQVTSYRYWINDDAASLTTANVTPGTAVQLNTVLNVGALPRNFNSFTFQFADNSGAWSVPITNHVQRNTGVVNGYEYWLDNAIADRVSSTIGPASVVNLIADLPIPTVFGDHLFTIRFRSTNGTWSVPLVSQFFFFTSIEELPGVQDLLLFPNPATEHLGLRLRSTEAAALRIVVLDNAGRTVLDGGSWSVHGESLRQWEIAALEPGMYTVRLIDEANGRAATLPFVKP